MVQVLLVDDEPIEREALSMIMRDSSMEIEIVGNLSTGSQAVEVVRETCPDIVFMDIVMAGIDGLEATRRIKQEAPLTQIVVLTAHQKFAYAQEALRVGAFDYLLKPARPQEVLDVLERAMARLEVEEREIAMRQRLAELMPYVRVQFAEDLLRGAVIDPEELQARAELCGLVDVPNLVMVVGVDDPWQRRWSEVEWAYLLQDRAFHAIQSCCEGQQQAIVVPKSGNTFVVLAVMPPSANGTPPAAALADRLRKVIKEQTQLVATVGIGHQYDDPGHLSRSYTEAKQAEEQKLLLGTDVTIHIDDLAASWPERLSVNWHRQERDLCASVRTTDRERALGLVEEIIDQMLASEVKHPDSIRSYALELLVMVLRAAAESGVASSNMYRSSLVRFSRELGHIGTARDLRHWLRRMIDQLMSDPRPAADGERSKALEMALAHIHEHFNEELTLDCVAEVACVTASYLSRLFKNKLGRTFVSYLTDIRVEEAKVLLASSGMPITEVAFAVGYQNPNYFSEVFKRTTGLTPSDYRRAQPG